jgi:MarR family transcriptional regulator, 2-MHQ and catechol-resistance regulon repressor
MGTRYKGSREEIRALDAFIKLVRAADSVSGRVEANFAPLKLTVSQFGVLETLFHVGPLYQKQLGQKILKSSGNITMVVDNLEMRGFVQRIRDEKDRRRYAVHLTTKGRRIIRAFFPRHVSRIVDEMNVLTKAELDELGRLCRKVGLGETRNAAR